MVNIGLTMFENSGRVDITSLENNKHIGESVDKVFFNLEKELKNLE